MILYKQSLLMLLAMTLLTGIAYPLLITLLAHFSLPDKAAGSLIWKEGKPIGSSLIGQPFKEMKYFWPRPSAIGYNPLESGGGGLGPTSAQLAAQVTIRRAAWAAWQGLHEGEAFAVETPEDLLFDSASGLDPHISQSAAYFQLNRVATARGWNEEKKEKVRRIIDTLVEHNPRVFPGEPGVNVLRLNLEIDKLL
jgi:potassium-transporting ATPase KdpC subunit